MPRDFFNIMAGAMGMAGIWLAAEDQACIAAFAGFAAIVWLYLGAN